MDAINGYTAALNVNNFLIIPIIGWTEALSTFEAQNAGGGKRSRMKEGWIFAMKSGMLAAAVLSLITVFLAKPLVGLYIHEPWNPGYVFGVKYLLILIPDFFFLLLLYSCYAVFKADGKMILYTIGSFLVLAIRIVLSWLLEGRTGLLILAWATDAGNMLVAFPALYEAKKMLNRKEEAIL